MFATGPSGRRDPLEHMYGADSVAIRSNDDCLMVAIF